MRFMLYLPALFLAAVLAIPTPQTRDDDKPDEVVVLASCDNGKTGAEFEIKDRIFYYSDDYERRKGGGSQDTVLQDQIHDPTPHDGVVSPIYWEAGTVDDPISATFPNDTRQFKVWGLPAGGAAYEVDSAVSGAATFDGVPFKCYKGDTSTTVFTNDGFICRAAFTCTRIERWIRKTNLTLDDAVVEVGQGSCKNGAATVINAKDAFGIIRDLAAHSGATAFDIGSGCSILFPQYLLASEGTATAEAIADIFVDQIGARVEAKRRVDVFSCPNGPALPGSMPKWIDANQDVLVYPRGGQFRIFSALQSNQEGWSLQAAVDFKVQCKCKDDTFGFLRELAAGLRGFGGWINAAYGTVAAAINIAEMELGAC